MITHCENNFYTLLMCDTPSELFSSSNILSILCLLSRLSRLSIHDYYVLLSAIYLANPIYYLYSPAKPRVSEPRMLTHIIFIHPDGGWKINSRN